MPTRSFRRWGSLIGALVFLPALPAGALAQTLDMRPPDWFNTDAAGTLASEDQSQRPQRIRLFRISTGFLSDPVNIDDTNVDEPENEPEASPEWLSLTVGNDNPFRDFRWPGDPGGWGYSRLDAQVQLVDTATTGFTFGFQAVTPAGLQANGVATGPTVVSPALAWFQSLGDGLALQGFAGKHIYLDGQDGRQYSRRVHCGLALQRELAGLPQVPGNVYLFVEALGRFHYTDATAGTENRPNVFDVLPGLQWRVGDSCWLTGGLVLPAQPSPYDSRRWQLQLLATFLRGSH